MKYAIMVVATTFIMMFSCSKPMCGCGPNDMTFFKATVTEVNNIDCGKASITFEPADAAAVRQITGGTGDIFIADQLADSLKVISKMLYVSIRKLEPSEEFACTMVGPTYPHLRVVYAFTRN